MSKKLLAGVGVVAALGVAVLPTVGSYAATTTVIKATVDEYVGCTSSNSTSEDALNLGTIAAGLSGSNSFTIGGATNNPAGFYITATPGALTQNPNTSEAIAYSAEALTSGEGWFLTVADGTVGATIGSTVTLNSANATNKRNNTWTVTANVSTTTETTIGTYQGTINWTCLAN